MAETAPTPATVEINDAIFCTHFKEVCSDCSFDGREENDAFFGFDPIDRDGIECPPATQNKEGIYQCKKHGSTLLWLEEANNEGESSGEEGWKKVASSNSNPNPNSKKTSGAVVTSLARMNCYTAIVSEIYLQIAELDLELKLRRQGSEKEQTCNRNLYAFPKSRRRGGKILSDQLNANASSPAALDISPVKRKVFVQPLRLIDGQVLCMNALTGQIVPPVTQS
ncbi:hypothetical protein NLJ89_g324 [Agrocybe chaxingu]|uniref:Uncharacterized protein n=1 Tax=Agrocybe chaxingu TaxID=84603 RepID=A0A9W8N252_9AGAR|nr:hypothetical protein NLJ89_g324 [Agrocybe chaxingu]